MVHVSSPAVPWPKRGLQVREYARYVEELVYSGYLAGYHGFSDLLPHLDGVYPSVAIESLRHLGQMGRIRRDVITGVEYELREQPRPFQEIHHEIVFPLAHPLDYDWRFSEESNGYLVSKAQHYLRRTNDSTLLIGTPSIMRSAIERGVAANFTLLDANESLLKSFREHSPTTKVIHCDIGIDPLPPSEAKVIISDPPWYEDTMQLFLWTAACMSSLGGFILFVLPPIGTRPGVKQERDRLVQMATQFGLRLRTLESGTISYVSPFFERNALRAQGILNVPTHWRRADLAVFQRVATPSSCPPHVSVESSLWQKYPIDGIQIQVLRTPRPIQGHNDPELVSIIHDTVVPDTEDILPSTSRRDSRRTRASVWTTGNRIFSCRDTELLSIILHAMQLSQASDKALARLLKRDISPQESESIETVVRHLQKIALEEQQECALFFR